MTTTTGIGVHDQNLERQMGGCMSGFFNLFDRSPILAGKRLPPPLPAVSIDSSSEPASRVGSPAISQELKKSDLHTKPITDFRSAVVDRPKPTFEVTESVKSPWKFNREAPRLSLDSRAIVDAKGSLRPRDIRVNTSAGRDAADEERENQQRRSPSVIARLMGLEPVPTNSSSGSDDPPEKKTELRRSASESRSRDYNRFFDAPSFFSPVSGVKTEIAGERRSDQLSNAVKNQNNNQRRLTVDKKSYYDTSDFFPAPEIIPAKYHHHHHHHQAVAIYGEIERRLRMKGIIDEPSKDLETLKNILEALQLKGLLHSSPHHNVVHDQRSTPSLVKRRPISHSGDTTRSSSPTARRKGVTPSIETQKRRGETTTHRNSARSPRKTIRSSDNYNQTEKRSPRSRRSTAEISHDEKILLSAGPTSPEDEVSTISESSYSTSSHTDNERWRIAEYRDGRNLLERCDKLLHNIADMNLNSTPNSAELQKPSPVSVLDSSFYKDDESSPSPVKKRAIDFEDAPVLMDFEYDHWSPPSSTILPKHPHPHHHHLDLDSSDGSDFSYVSQILNASIYLPHQTDLFLLLEKHNSITDTNTSILHRKLIFDTITEILGRARDLPPWKAALSLTRPTLDQIWAEFSKIQERGPGEDLLEVVCGVLKKDLAGDSINGWGNCHVEMSQAVLDIERLIFKDLIGEAIGDLAILSRKHQALRRKLIF